MSKNTYWIVDVDGVKAQVTGADERDRWTRVHGWSETTEPAGSELVWLRHDVHGGTQVFSAQAAAQWEGLGWKPSPPPEPVDLTKDPLLVDQGTASASDAPPADNTAKTPSRTRAASGDEKE